ncbi:MarR family winged helix-turn-helix transcriptional regulator [Paenibacillus puldeungensis]|uniref:MarR family winged helix-turn-helix transcriptional regulator n=1 Tax=Paenibacillus puldeungensis TaxID=696536 RepID=A0ABW3RZR9_9BACL
MIFDPQHRKNVRSARISMALFRLSQAIKKVTQEESDVIGLSPVQVQALLFCQYTRSDVATVGNFASTIGTTHVTAVKIVNGLVSKGLISKVQKSDDRRVTLLQLTSAGIEIIPKLENWGHVLEEALHPISDIMLANLELGLGSIISSLEDRGHLTVAEPCLGCIHFHPNVGETAQPHYCDLIHKYLTHQASLQQCPEHTPLSKPKA